MKISFDAHKNQVDKSGIQYVFHPFHLAEQMTEEDLCIQKPTFPSLELADYIAEEEFESIELVGLVSHMCVLSNAVMAKAAAPEAEIVIDAACTASFDTALHEKALDVMEALQMTVLNR